MGIVLSCIVAAGLLNAQGTRADGVSPAQERAVVTVRGVVLIDDASGRPLRNAVVTITGAAGRRQAVTDEDGRFAFERLPTGRYSLAATKPAYVPMSYGALQFDRPGLPIALAAGETATVEISLPPGAVISGVVRDVEGRALADTTVRLFQTVLRDGVRRLELVRGLTGTGLVSTRTDHSGEYRLYGLPPGAYLVAAAPLSLSGVLTAPAGPTVTPPTFHPSTPYPPQASPVVVAKGEERRDVDISMTSVPAATVSGVVVGGRSPDQAVQVLMAYDTARGEAPFQFARAIPVGTDGRWEFATVPPGNYRITATISHAATGFGAAPAIAGWAEAEIGVTGSSISNVLLSLRPTLTLVGVVETDGGASDAEPGVSLLLLDAGRSLALRRPSSVAAGQFEIPGLLPGRYVFVDPSRTKSILSALVDGVAVGDMPFELTTTSPSPSATITVARAMPTAVSGLLTHLGKPAAGYAIVAFSNDPRYWYPRSPRVATAITGTDGRYVLANLQPGDYYLTAFSTFSDEDAPDVSLLEAAAAQAFSFTLEPGGHPTLDFAIR